MTVKNRSVRRLALVSAITSQITDLQAVYDHLAKDFNGQSPVATVESSGWLPLETPAEPQDLNYIVGFWARRDDAQTGAQAEQKLDDLAEDLANLVFNTFHGKFTEESTTMYAQIGGHSYRVEFHYVRLQDW